jgi:hypothetical protein
LHNNGSNLRFSISHFHCNSVIRALQHNRNELKIVHLNHRSTEKIYGLAKRLRGMYRQANDIKRSLCEYEYQIVLGARVCCCIRQKSFIIVSGINAFA